MSRTRIVIFQMKEIIYTAVFVGLGILLLVLLFFMFWPGKGKGQNFFDDRAGAGNDADSERDCRYQ